MYPINPVIYVIYLKSESDNDPEPLCFAQSVWADPDKANEFCNALAEYYTDYTFYIYEFCLNDNENWRETN